MEIGQTQELVEILWTSVVKLEKLSQERASPGEIRITRLLVFVPSPPRSRARPRGLEPGHVPQNRARAAAPDGSPDVSPFKRPTSALVTNESGLSGVTVKSNPRVGRGSRRSHFPRLESVANPIRIGTSINMI